MCLCGTRTQIIGDEADNLMSLPYGAWWGFLYEVWNAAVWYFESFLVVGIFELSWSWASFTSPEFWAFPEGDIELL